MQHTWKDLSGRSPLVACVVKEPLTAIRKRVFVLGPSHHFYLTRCALSQCESYETPLGDLKIDRATIAELHKTGQFDRMSMSVDTDEHSIEMHLPYIHKLLTRSVEYPCLFFTRSILIYQKNVPQQHRESSTNHPNSRG